MAKNTCFTLPRDTQITQKSEKRGTEDMTGGLLVTRKQLDFCLSEADSTDISALSPPKGCLSENPAAGVVTGPQLASPSTRTPAWQ